MSDRCQRVEACKVGFVQMPVKLGVSSDFTFFLFIRRNHLIALITVQRSFPEGVRRRSTTRERT